MKEKVSAEDRVPEIRRKKRKKYWMEEKVRVPATRGWKGPWVAVRGLDLLHVARWRRL